MTLVARYAPIADGLAALFQPHVEVVLHDLASGTVAYVANNLSKRAIGDESGLDTIGFDPAEAVLGPYEKTNWDGGRIRSVSIVARDDNGTAIGVICVNMALAVFDGARAALTLLLDGPQLAPQPDKLFRDDWQERINVFLQAWLQDHQLTLAGLTRQHKQALVQALFAEGAFGGRSAAPYVASLLGLSRATVFNHLKLLRSER